MLAQNGAVRVWSVATGEVLFETVGDSATLLDLEFARDGSLLAISQAGVISTWDPDGRPMPRRDTGLGRLDRGMLAPHATHMLLLHPRDPDSVKIQRSRRDGSSPWEEAKRCSPCVSALWSVSVTNNRSLGTLAEHSHRAFVQTEMGPGGRFAAVADYPGDESVVPMPIDSGKQLSLIAHRACVSAIAVDLLGRSPAFARYDWCNGCSTSSLSMLMAQLSRWGNAAVRMITASPRPLTLRPRADRNVGKAYPPSRSPRSRQRPPPQTGPSSAADPRGMRKGARAVLACRFDSLC